MRRVLFRGTALIAVLSVALLIPSARASAVNRTPPRPSYDAARQLATSTLTIPSSQARFTVRRLEGDVTADCLVNIDDYQQVAAHYPSTDGNAAYASVDDINLPQPDGSIDISDLQFVVGRKASTCAAPRPAQPPALIAASSGASSVTLAPDPQSSNMWVCSPGQGACGQIVPSSLDHQDWQNGIVMDELMTISTRGLGIVGYQFELQYDPTLFQPPQIGDLGVLNDNGVRATTCNQTNPRVGDVVFECSSTGAENTAAAWSGPRSVTQVTLALQPGVGGTMSAASGNARSSDVLNTNASATTIGASNPPPSVGGIAEVPHLSPSAVSASPIRGRIAFCASIIVLIAAPLLVTAAWLARGRRRRHV
jgi:hypothetical protein